MKLAESAETGLMAGDFAMAFYIIECGPIVSIPCEQPASVLPEDGRPHISPHSGAPVSGRAPGLQIHSHAGGEYSIKYLWPILQYIEPLHRPIIEDEIYLKICFDFSFSKNQNTTDEWIQ